MYISQVKRPRFYSCFSVHHRVVLVVASLFTKSLSFAFSRGKMDIVTFPIFEFSNIHEYMT